MAGMNSSGAPRCLDVGGPRCFTPPGLRSLELKGPFLSRVGTEFYLSGERGFSHLCFRRRALAGTAPAPERPRGGAGMRSGCQWVGLADVVVGVAVGCAGGGVGMGEPSG